MNTAPGVLDPEVVAELRRFADESGNQAFLAQLVGIFLANAPSRMAAIRDAISRRDGATIETTAHTLKSNCSMLGAMRMAHYCGELENLGESSGFDRAAALLATAEAELARVVTAVEALLQKPGA